MEELEDEREDLLLGQPGGVEQLLEGPEVLLQLVPDVLVDAALGLGGLAAGHEGLELGQVGVAGVGVGGLDVDGDVLGDGVAVVHVLLDAVLEPLAQIHLAELLLHGGDVDLVVVVDDVHLLHDAGHVADLLLSVLLGLDDLVAQSVPEVQNVGDASISLPLLLIK